MKKTILLLALGLLCQPLYPQHTEYPQIGAQVFIEPGQTDKQIDGFFRILAQHGFETARIRMFGRTCCARTDRGISRFTTKRSMPPGNTA